MTGDSLAGLPVLLAAVWDTPAVELVSTQRILAGASRNSWAVDVRAGEEVHHLVVQCERTSGRGLRSTVAVEKQLLTAASMAGVPVVELVATDPAGEFLGGPAIVTRRLDGETIPRRILRAPELANARSQFARQCGQILAAIHSIPAGTVPLLDVRNPVEDIETMLAAAQDRRPVFELGLRWLRDNRPARRPDAVVHGDFRNGNLIMGPDGVRAVLDWELAHLGDPVEDLAWVCARVWRFGASHVVGGMGRRPELLSAYAEAGGTPPTREEIFWWQVLSTVRWGVMCLEQARTHLSGEARSVELAAIGRRACEMEYELLRTLS